MKKFLALAILLVAATCTLSAKLNLPIKRIGNDSYYYYEVKKNETVQDIANKIGVNSDIILKYNPSARNGVAKKQLLFLPVSDFDKIAKQPSDKKNMIADDVVTHTVKSGESVYGISRTYGVTESDLLAANPSLAYGLKTGEQLIIPVKPLTGSSKIVYHTIKSGETLYGIAKSYNTTIEKLIELNPGIASTNLQIDDVVMIQPNTTKDIIVQKDIKQFVPYVVTAGDTYESVAAANGISVKILKDANPEVSKLKKGKTIYIPRDAIDKQVVNTSTMTEEQLENSYKDKFDEVYNDVHLPNKDNSICITILLPFQTDMKNKSKNAKDYDEFFNGFKMALDSVGGKLTKPLNVVVYDTRLSIGITDSLLALPELKKSDIIIAPSESDELQHILAFGQKNNIDVLNCFVAQSEDYISNQRSMQVHIPTPYLNASIIEMLRTKYQNYELVFLDDPSGTSKEIYEEIKKYANVSKHLHKTLTINNDFTGKTLSRYLDPASKYLFIPANGKEAFINKFAPGIIEAKATRVDCRLELLGHPEYTMYIKKHKDEFMAMDTHIYSRFFLPDNAQAKALNNRYIKQFGGKPSNSTPNMSVFGFDLGMFLVNAYANDITPGDKASAYEGIQTNFFFERANNWTGYINKSVRIINLTPNKDIKIIDLND
ncbi:MAG: LysM peptidoglycan-binding domain-containing protein [Muribaculaceae bacterium]|nr:LysM peptidoglycan-binding domain-containing protein [Muribaculaceae bacterium]